MRGKNKIRNDKNKELKGSQERRKRTAGIIVEGSYKWQV